MDLPHLTTLPITPGAVTALVIVVGIVVGNLSAGRVAWHLPRGEHAFGLVGLATLINGQYMGLVDAPRERMMGDVGRILYVHVPSAWVTLVTFLFCFLFAVASLASGSKVMDALVEATAEVGVVLAALLQLTGMLFAKPTWGVFWDWDPRLVSTAVMMLSFMGVLALRAQLDDADRRATWTAVGAILATTSMIVTYMSVKWWRSIHQPWSSPDTVAEPMVLVLRMNAFAFLFLGVWLVTRRARIALARARADEAPPLPAAPGVTA